MDDSSAMRIAEELGLPFHTIEVDPIKIPGNLTDSTAVDRD
jgi:hypothetical protein